MMRYIIATPNLLLTLSMLFQVDVNPQSTSRALTEEADSDQLECPPSPAFIPESCRIALLQINPAKPNADIYFKLEGNT